MRRVPTIKATPKERKLDLIKNEVDSFQIILDNMKIEEKVVVKSIKEANEILEILLDDQSLAEGEIKKAKKLLSKRKQELFDLDKKIDSFKDIVTENIDLINGMQSKAEFELKDTKESTKILKFKIKVVTEDAEKNISKLKKEKELIYSETIKAEEKLGNIKDSISNKTGDLIKLDKDYAGMKDMSEKMKSAAASYEGVATDLRADINVLEDKKKIALKNLSEIDSKLMEVEKEKEELLKKTVALKESNVRLVEREMLLNQKEKKINKLYKKAGIEL